MPNKPSIFLAYPSDRNVSDSMSRLADDLRALDYQVRTWRQLRNPGFLVEPIKEAIESADLTLAETTFGNPNVLFEVGYAIGRGKHVFQLENLDAAKPRRLNPLAVVRSIQYSRRAEITQFLEEVELTGPTISEQIGLEFLERRTGTLYFIPSRRGADFNETIWRVCQASPFSELR